MLRLALLAVVCAGVYLALRALLGADPAAVAHLRRAVRRGGAPQEPQTPEKASGWTARLGLRLEAALRRGDRMQALLRRLRAADLNLRPGEFLLAALALAAAGAAGGLLLGPAAALLLGLLSLSVPFLLLALRSQERSRRVGQALPDALGAIANALRSGFSLLQSVDACARQTTGVLRQELELLLAESRVGVPLDEAMQNLTGRVRSADLELVVTAITIQRQVGGNLAEVLDRIQGTIRERVRLEGEMRALTAQGRMSALIVGGMPVGLLALVSVISPRFVAPLYESPLGHLFLLAALGLQLVGFFALHRIVRLEV